MAKVLNRRHQEKHIMSLPCPQIRTCWSLSANDIGHSARQATEILAKKSESSDSATPDPKSWSAVVKKEGSSESPNAKAVRKPVSRKQASLDIWKVLTILNTALLLELIALCLFR